MRKMLSGFAGLMLVAVAGVSAADAAGPFNPGANNDVLAIAVEPDGKILGGGEFTAIGGATGTTPRNYTARPNADAPADGWVNPGADNATWAFVVQPDGKIVVGGEFTTLAGASRQRLARLNADGTLDTSFNSSANDSVRALARQTDGKIVVGGRFTTLGGGARNSIGRINADG